MSIKKQTDLKKAGILSPPPATTPGRDVFIDAGIENIHLRIYPPAHTAHTAHTTHTAHDSLPETSYRDIIIPSNVDAGGILKHPALLDLYAGNTPAAINNNDSLYITGKLADITQKALQHGEIIMPAAALWASAKYLLSRVENQGVESIGIIDLSASGYMVTGIAKNGAPQEGLPAVNPRCGAGTGINLNRVLEKLAVPRDHVDIILSQFLGREGKKNRDRAPVRSDRCGVFSSSATVSDKNQGIPLDYALAITIKSEVMKPCKKIPAGTTKVYLHGGVFRWQYARDCAEDLLLAANVKEIVYDHHHSLMMDGMKYLVQQVKKDNFREQEPLKLRKPPSLTRLPSFQTLKNTYEEQNLYKRLPDPVLPPVTADFVHLPVNVGLDIGSTMAKLVIADARTGSLLFHHSYSNHGDTIETVKHIFSKLKAGNIDRLKIQNLGITGSGRYQVKKTLTAIYPHLQERITVMVENYAHAWGSIEFAGEHIARLKQQGYREINEDFCLLIDIGGEDTKISVISLKDEDLFDNAMNIKCSAGTGSLMDTLCALFGMGEGAAAYGRAQTARCAYAIDAACAVFLMENAGKMQAEGYHKDEILASCCYAIVENMARSLWPQVEFPRNAVALLHGQTMRSDPLPLAVTHRGQEYTDSKMFCLVPPLPGHRACIGLVKNLQRQGLPEIGEYCRLDDLLEREFHREMITCRGAACGDKLARCARTYLESPGLQGKIALTLGGCTAVNEFQAQKTKSGTPGIPNAYLEIRAMIDSRHPKSTDPRRLVIPRSFTLSEWAFFFGALCEQLGIPVHIDNVREKDILAGQPFFTIDTCAPQIGATGQFTRLAGEDHGIILVPQIDFLPVEGSGASRTCTTNQGGLLVALHHARAKYPDARFIFFDISLRNWDPDFIADQLYSRFQPVFKYYELTVSRPRFTRAVQAAILAHETLGADSADLAADFIRQALHDKLHISIVNAREYVLNPGIFDSHIGKLLHDKGVMAIPTYVFAISPDPRFEYLYWKNPRDLLTKANAIARGRFHHIIKHPRLKELIRQIEAGDTGSVLSLVTVSTFRCGPDSVTLPVLAEVTKNIPSLTIQSDAMIAQLAHLENRVNTHLHQLNKPLLTRVSPQNRAPFSIVLLDEFLLDGISKENDVLYFPTMNDNRAITSAFRASGFTVMDNFSDDTYDLVTKTRIGRKYVGDSACAPLAAVFTDMLQAVEDFVSRKDTGDPRVKGKERVVLFMHYGDGPCRQGQYIDICKFNLYRKFRAAMEQRAPVYGPATYGPADYAPGPFFPIKFLANGAFDLHDGDDFASSIDDWTMMLGFQGLILKEVLMSLFLKGGSACEKAGEFQEFDRAFRSFKKDLYEYCEHRLKPGAGARFIVNCIERVLPGLGGAARYIGYGLYNNNGLRKKLKEFAAQWIKNPPHAANPKKRRLKIHVNGEVYLRTAQVHELFKFLVDTLGYGAFELDYSPPWGYFEYIWGNRIHLIENDINMYRDKLTDTKPRRGGSQREQLTRTIKEKEKLVKDIRENLYRFRYILVRPLYEAAGLHAPHEIQLVLDAARPVLSTLKPTGELASYVGETIIHLGEGFDLVVNTAPEGCLVASMGEMLTPRILQAVDNKKARIQHLFSQDGEINEDLFRLSLLKLMGPEEYYSR